MQRLKRFGLITAIVVPAIWLVGSAIVAYGIALPHSRSFDDIAELEGHKVEAVEFSATDGCRVSGWYAPTDSKRAIIFTHGIGADRRQLEGNMAFYLARGYAGLAIDLRGHGKSEPRPVSMGWYERNDLLGAIAFLKEKGYEHIGANGISLGAATIIYAAQDKPSLDFLILESPYYTIDTALDNRITMVGAPVWIAAAFRRIAPYFTGADNQQLRPLDWMDDITTPMLLLAGDNEAEIPVSETEELFAACAAATKQMFLFKDATHRTRLVKRRTENYTKVVDEFLAKVYPPAVTSLAAVQ
jgi:alpha-beta hydrolase superfamily lysophospholipase